MNIYFRTIRLALQNIIMIYGFNMIISLTPLKSRRISGNILYRTEFHFKMKIVAGLCILVVAAAFLTEATGW